MQDVFFESSKQMTMLERNNRGGLLPKCRKLAKLLDMENSIEKGDTVAIKLHLGERGNPSYLSPAIAGFFADLVKECGGRPFVTDTTTLYRRARHTMFDYLETAARNGFTSQTMGCPVIIADGLKGQSGTAVAVESARLLKEVCVAEYISDADVLISLAHVTMHPTVPLGASVKNVGMGCATKSSKIAMHTVGNKPTLNVPDEAMLAKIGAGRFVLVAESLNRRTGLGSRFGTWLLQRGFTPTYDHVGTHREGCGGLWQQMGHQGIDSEQIQTKVREMV